MQAQIKENIQKPQLTSSDTHDHKTQEHPHNNLFINGLGEIKDSRSCTVQGKNGFLYLDAAPNRAHALLGHNKLSVSQTSQKQVQDKLSALNANYRCVSLAKSSDEALKIAQSLATELRGNSRKVRVIDPISASYASDSVINSDADMENLLLIADEQRSIARTGEWFASNSWKHKPSFIVVGEALAAGHPFGAVFAHRTIKLDELPHTASQKSLEFVNASLETIARENLLSDTARLEKYFSEKLQSLLSTCPHHMEIKSVGLHAQLTFETPELTEETLIGLRERGILLATDEQCTLKIYPPLRIRAAEIDAISGSLRAQLMGWPASLPAPCCGDHDH